MKPRRLQAARTRALLLLAGSLLLSAASGMWWARGQVSGASPSADDGSLIAEFRRVEVASVSDALEQLSGKRRPAR